MMDCFSIDYKKASADVTHTEAYINPNNLYQRFALLRVCIQYLVTSAL